MSEYKRGKIGSLALDLTSKKMIDIDSGVYDFLLKMDMESIIQKFNNGDFSVLNTPEIERFLELEIKPIDLIKFILSAKALLQMKKDFYRDVESQQDGMVYNPNASYYRDRHRYITSDEVSYTDVDKIFKLAERMLSTDKIYSLLNFLLKYENLKSSIATRRRLLYVMKKNPSGTEKLYQVLNQYDSNVGIVKIVENGEIRVSIGTKHDMAISELISHPFPADCDEPGYDYGPHDDFYHPAHKVTKEFIENGVTPNHKKAIEEEKRYRARLSQSTIDTEGFILYKEYAIIISSLELTKLGIDPKRVGWQPLSLKTQPQNLFKIFDSYDDTRYLPLGSKVQIQKDVILSKIQH